jgi:hypothetical protein
MNGEKTDWDGFVRSSRRVDEWGKLWQQARGILFRP